MSDTYPGVELPSLFGGRPFFALNFLDEREESLLLIAVASLGRHVVVIESAAAAAALLVCCLFCRRLMCVCDRIYKPEFMCSIS